MSAFSQSELIADGRSTRAEHLVVEGKFATNNPALRADIYCMHDIVLQASDGILQYEN
jgi:hypothetical protein